MQLDGKIALITGGGSGIGRETAVLFANHGAKIAIADLNPDGGQETVQLIRDAGGAAFFVQTDVSQAAQVENMVNAVVAEYGRLDIAFNNAGIEGAPVRTADVTEAEFDQIMAVSTFLCGPHSGELPLRLSRSSGICNDVYITPGNDIRGISRFNIPVPYRTLLKWLRRYQNFLQLLSISPHSQQCRKFSVCLRTIDIYA